MSDKVEKEGDVSNSSSEDEIEENEAGPSRSKGAKLTSNPFFDKSKGQTEPEVSDSDLSLSDDDDEDEDFGSDDSEDDENEEPKEDMTEPDLENDEDPLIQALKRAKEKRVRTAPPDIHFKKGDLNDISYHPEVNVLATADFEGEINLFEVDNEQNDLKKKIKIHKESVRTIEFDLGGKNLYSGSVDRAIKVTDVETFSVKNKYLKAHDAEVNKVFPINEFLFASGDDNGIVKLWDLRRPSKGSSSDSVLEFKCFEDIVKDFHVDEDYRLMVAASGEGTIQSFNLRGKKAELQSELYEGEMNCLGIVHKDSKLVAGCGDGRLYMFNWGEFGYHSADFPGHPDAINALVSATENVVITGCEDGTVRAVHLYPHRFLGSIGHHSDNLPIEKIDISSSGEIVATISHDQRVKFWNISFLEQMDYDKTRKPFHNRKNLKMRKKSE